LVWQRQRIKTLTAQLETLNPPATLSRGYAIVQKGQTIITQTGQVHPGDPLVVQVTDGGFEVNVK
jgi:exodeoxyribonuclease VII large subunit